MKTIHLNSITAYWQGRTDLFNKRHRLIIGIFQSAHSPITDREAMIAARAADPNFVRPRITELIEAGILEESGSRVCPVTGKTVRLVKLRVRETQRELALAPEQVATVAAGVVERRAS